MSVASHIARIESARNRIRNKFIELGLATSTDGIDALADASETIENRGAISANVKEGETYTIPKGFHNGSGTVSGIAGGGNYSLQSKRVTPTKKQLAITSDDGYYGLSDVVVEPIPDAYQDVTSVTAVAANVLTGKVFVDKTGAVVPGAMPNNNNIGAMLSVNQDSFAIPEGYHSGSGRVRVAYGQRTVMPMTTEQTVVGTNGDFLSEVTVRPIPANFKDTTDVTAEAAHVLIGSQTYVLDYSEDPDNPKCVLVEGTMPNNGEKSATLHLSKTFYDIPYGFHEGGRVEIYPVDKTVTPTKSAQDVVAGTAKVLGTVKVLPIPDAYQDVTSVDVLETEVLVGKKFVDAKGAVKTGTMSDNGDVSGTIDGLTVLSFAIPAGYTTGGTVSLTNDIELALAAI